jgi:hypothetical protein
MEVSQPTDPQTHTAQLQFLDRPVHELVILRNHNTRARGYHFGDASPALCHYRYTVPHRLENGQGLSFICISCRKQQDVDIREKRSFLCLVHGPKMHSIGRRCHRGLECLCNEVVIVCDQHSRPAGKRHFDLTKSTFVKTIGRDESIGQVKG